MQKDKELLGADAAAVETAEPVVSDAAPHVVGQTLLDKARAAKRKKTDSVEPTIENIDLALAWLYGEVTTSQCARAMTISADNSYTNRVVYRLASIVRHGVAAGLIVVTKAQGKV